MSKKLLFSQSDDLILKLKILAEEKENIRRKLEVTAEQLALKAKQLATTAKEKEKVRERLAVTAEELKDKAEALAIIAKDKENVRKELVIIKNSADTALEYAENILDTVREPMLALDQNLRVVKVNRSFYEFFKVNSKETMGQFIYNIGNKQWNIPKLRELLEKILPQKTTFDNYEVEHDFTTIGRRSMLLNARQIERGIGQKRTILLAIEDITEKKELDKKLAEKAQQLAVIAVDKEEVRKKLEVTAEKLKRSRETLEDKVLERTKDIAQAKARDEAILQSIGEGLVVVDKEGKIIYVNQVFEQILGWGKEEVIGKSLVKIIPREDEAGNKVQFKERVLSQVLAGKKATISISVLYIVRKDRTKFLADIVVTPIVIDNEIIGAVEVFRDVTLEKDIDRMKTEFISLASHQLRTPLSAMRWFSEMLLAGDAGKLTKDQTEFVTNISLSNKRMIDLVNGLLNISRIESGRIIIDPKPTDLITLVKDVLKEIDQKIKEKKQQVIISVHKNLPKINIDPKLIYEVYKNLLTNANKYTPVGGEISIFISKKDKEVISQISDNGYGIPLKDQPHIFERFYRAENIIKLETEGTGLGLYLAKAITESSNGKIWFKSQEKVGTSFWFTLPLVGVKQKKGEVTINS